MEIIRAGMQEAGRAAALAQLLWPGHAQAELEQELAGYLQGPEGAVFLAREDGADVGFAQCGLRRDYVEGTHTSPVGVSERRVCARGIPGPGRCDGAAARLRGVGRGKRLCRICKRLWAGQRRKRRVSSARRLCRGGAHHLLHKAAVRNVESEPLRDA